MPPPRTVQGCPCLNPCRSPVAGDVIIFHPPREISPEGGFFADDNVYIKRVVAVEGDTVEVRRTGRHRGPVGRCLVTTGAGLQGLRGKRADTDGCCGATRGARVVTRAHLGPRPVTRSSWVALAGGVTARARQPASLCNLPDHIWAARWTHVTRMSAFVEWPADSINDASACPSPQVKGGALYVNGNARTEPFINERPAYQLPRLVVPSGDVSARTPLHACFAHISAAGMHVAGRFTAASAEVQHTLCENAPESAHAHVRRAPARPPACRCL